MESQQNDNEKGSSNKCNLVLRVLAIAATVTAAVVMGIDEETKTIRHHHSPTACGRCRSPNLESGWIEVPLSKFGDFGDIEASWRWSNKSLSEVSCPFFLHRYFVVANAIVSFYSLLSLILSISTKSQKTRLGLLISIADIAALALLFSGFGERGISNVGWKKVCNVYTKFCAKVTVSVAVSFVAGVAYVVLLLLALVGLHKRGHKG
ncbi:CASP-like protein 1E2 [Asparagus officinalis]|uniref:CASP-like protein 1E2 n=1 Tax=Asparagus officinalis TaxID=4686 RepID=UPI00098E460F|nr:CASP-like protein 1E2 [Asparagus officinalis]